MPQTERGRVPGDRVYGTEALGGRTARAVEGYQPDREREPAAALRLARD